MKHDSDTQRKRILIVKLSSLGDLFHALPAVHEMKTGLPAQVDWVVQEEYVDLVKCFTDVDRVIPFPRRGFLGKLGSLLSDVRKTRYDMIIDLQGLLKSALVSRMARGVRRIGPSFHREGSRLLYSDVPGRGDRGRHAVEQCLDTVRHLALTPGPASFPVAFPGVPVVEPEPRVAIVPASRWRTKNWPTDMFAEVVRIVRRHRQVSFYLLGGEDDAAVCRRVAEANGEEGVVNLAGRQSLVQTGGMLKQMDLLISNDSGPVHMAVAVGTPTLVLFGPTDPGRTGPYGEGHRVVTAPIDCRPCFSRICRRNGGECLKSITPDEVAQAALGILASGDDSPRPD